MLSHVIHSKLAHVPEHVTRCFVAPFAHGTRLFTATVNTCDTLKVVTCAEQNDMENIMRDFMRDHHEEHVTTNTRTSLFQRPKHTQ